MSQQREFALPAELTAACVHNLHREFERFLQSPGLIAIELNGAAVRRADTAGLQLLHAFVRTAEERRLRWKFTAVSAVLLRSAKLLGLDTVLAIAAGCEASHTPFVENS